MGILKRTLNYFNQPTRAQLVKVLQDERTMHNMIREQMSNSMVELQNNLHAAQKQLEAQRVNNQDFRAVVELGAQLLIHRGKTVPEAIEMAQEMLRQCKSLEARPDVTLNLEPASSIQ